MENELSELRSRITQSLIGRKHVPQALRLEVVATVERARAVGMGHQELAMALGMNAHTLMGWRVLKRRYGNRLRCSA